MAKPPKAPKAPKAPRAKRQILVATGRRLEARRDTLTKWKEGELKRKKRSIDVEQLVISPRGREVGEGVVSPFEEPPEGMPTSKQDYFLGSRAIRHMAYDSKRQILEIIFQTGYGYHFYGVPENVWINLKMAQSKGRFFMKHIYGYWIGPKGEMMYFPKYTYRRIK